ncbi:hypothetical protein [Paraburkholderia sp. MM5477-R1]|uniref:hypothetical protein n=1 Tax=Paraburkholderia sp. MM5477-R1 TaxID=2991062 RepID=UPI003D1CEB69
MKWSKKAARANVLPPDEWPKLDYSKLSKEDQEFLENRENAVRMVIAGRKYKDIRDVTGIGRDQARRITMLCLSPAKDGRIMGFRGLLPFTRLNNNIRRNPIAPKRRDQQGGMSCALQSILARFPDLEQKMIRQIRKEKEQGTIPEFRIKGTDLHRIFTAFLKGAGVGENEWPFSAKYNGRKSINLFMRAVLENDAAAAVSARGEKDAKAHFATGSGVSPIIPFSEPYDAVEIDAHHIDALFTVAFKTPMGTEVESVLERLWLIAIVERLSTAVLAYRVIYRTEVTAVDVAGLIRELKSNLVYGGVEAGS